MKECHIQNIQANIEKMVDLGGHCDCEVLMNVDPNTWAERKEEALIGPDMMGKQEWMQFISDVLDESGYSDSEKI